MDATRRADGSATTATAPRVAVVEDHQLFAECLAVVLEAEGYTASRIPVTGGSAAMLAAIEAEAADVAVLDLALGPGGDGMVLVPGLRAAGVEVVVVTASTEPARHGEALHLGAAAVLEKSTSVDVVVETVRAVVDGRPPRAEGPLAAVRRCD